MVGPIGKLGNRRIAHDIYKQRLAQNVDKLAQDILAGEQELARLDQVRQDQARDPSERQKAHDDFQRIFYAKKRMERERKNTEQRLHHADALAAASMARGAAKAVGGGARVAVGAAGKPVGWLKRGASKLGSGAVFLAQSNWLMNLFLILAIIVYVLEIFFFAFNRSPAINPLVMFCYGLLVVLGTFAYGGFDMRRFAILIGLAALYVWFFPWLLDTFNAPEPVQAALFWIPIWLFLIFKTSLPGSFAYTVSGFLVKLIIFVFVIITLFYLSTLAAGVRFDSGFEWKTAFDYVWQPVKKAVLWGWNALIKFPKFVIGWFDKTWNEAYYIGQVEENRGAALGVYIEDFHPLEEMVYEGTVIDLLAKLRAASFVGNVTISMACHARAADGRPGVVQGLTEPNSTFVEGRIVETVFCRYYENQLAAQSYTVSFEASFNFETWAYTEYTFVDADLRRGYAARGIDINQVLGIPDVAEAIYTNGPIMLGTIDTPLPQSVDLAGSKWTMPFAVTVENKWDGGEVRKVNEYVVYTPQELEFVPGSCNAEPADISEEERIEGLNGKRFSLPANRLNQDYRFTTLTCRLQLANSPAQSEDDSRASLLGQTTKAVRTFAVKVKYDYLLKNEIDLDVQEYEGGLRWEPPVVEYAPEVPEDTEEPLIYLYEEHDWPAPSGSPNIGDGRLNTTVYFTPLSSEYGVWYAGGADLAKREAKQSTSAYCRDAANPSICCIRPSVRGFYEDVMCQGSGNHEGRVYTFTTINPSEAESMPISGSFKNGITAKGADPEPFRTIAVNSVAGTDCHIPYGYRVYLEFPQANNPWTGWYVAEDTGGAMKRQCKIDVYAGVGKAANSDAEKLVSNRHPRVWWLSQEDFNRQIRDPYLAAQGVGGTATGTAIASAAEDELGRFAGRDECDSSVSSILDEYDAAGGCSLTCNEPWSAAFISYVTSAAGVSFPASCTHTVYFSSIRDSPGQCVALSMDALPTITPGDILCQCRDSGCPITYGTARSQSGHCDIVTAVSGDSITAIGGNVGDTVATKELLRSTIEADQDYFGIVRCGGGAIA